MLGQAQQNRSTLKSQPQRVIIQISSKTGHHSRLNKQSTTHILTTTGHHSNLNKNRSPPKAQKNESPFKCRQPQRVTTQVSMKTCHQSSLNKKGHHSNLTYNESPLKSQQKQVTTKGSNKRVTTQIQPQRVTIQISTKKQVRDARLTMDSLGTRDSNWTR